MLITIYRDGLQAKLSERQLCYTPYLLWADRLLGLNLEQLYLAGQRNWEQDMNLMYQSTFYVQHAYFTLSP
ncbi:hypothetical protein N7454_003982 [Penicillium verhagenii]|nr:hypothetical protein N7454_003982 [Penicillium verhagenii]